jgi:uncharacterized protein (DUF362 family)
MNLESLSRRRFLRLGAVVAAGTPLGPGFAPGLLAEATPAVPSPSVRSAAKVAVVRCRSYGGETRTALAKCFDLLGGIGALVKDKTVTVKINLTGTDFSAFKGRPTGESYHTHYETALALASLLMAAGARRVRFVESTNSKAVLEQTLGFAGWDVNALRALGAVEFENTRNLGLGKRYVTLRVPGGGQMFSAFDLNHSYGETDVLVSLAKLKQHVTAGVTLTMKNLFGATPNSLYGDQAGSEAATDGRFVLHSSRGHHGIKLPGLKDGVTSEDSRWRVPRVVADVCGARPVQLAIIDGITSMTHGEGPWCEPELIKLVSPGLLIAGLNPVSTDAVGTALMGYADPRAPRGTPPFDECDNHLVLAEQAGVGLADLQQIDVRGLAIAEARHPYG